MYISISNSIGSSTLQGGGVTPVASDNTFIGGVGATTVTSAADFAALTTLSESDIENFSIDGNNNVSFAVTAPSYDFNINSFLNDSNITYLIDANGLATSNVSCRNATNLQYLYLPSATTLGRDFYMDNVTSLVRVNYEGVTTILSRINLADCESLEKLDFRSLNRVQNDTNGSLLNLKGLKYFYLGALNNFDSGQLQRILIRNVARFPYFLYAGQTSGDMKVYYNTSWGVQNQQAFTRCNAGWQIGDTCTINGLTYTAVDGTPTTDGEFNCAADQSANQRQTNFTAAINNDTRTGTVGDLAAANDGSYMYIYCTTVGSAGNAITAVMGAGNTGTASFDWSPFKYGSDIYQALVDMRDIEGATMTEVSFIIAVNAPTNLSASSVGSTSFTLNFTEPIANANGTEIYEVWVEETNNKANPKNYFYYQYVSGTGISITGLEPNTEYTVKVRTQDGQMQFSAFSNTISLSTQNLGPEIVINGDFSDPGTGNVISQSGGILVNDQNRLKITSDGSSGFSRGVWETNGNQGDTFKITANIISITGSTRFVDISNNNSIGLSQGEFETEVTLGSAGKQVGFGGLSDTSFELVLDNVSVKEVLN